MITGGEARKKFTWWPWVMVVTALFLFALLPCAIGIAPPEAIAASQVKRVVLACRAYATDHDGRYPSDLHDLIPDYLEEENLLYVRKQWSNEPLALIYHVEVEAESPEKVPLVTYPLPVNGKRIVGYTAGHVAQENWE